MFQNNEVERLRKNAFQHLTGLQQLKLSGNKISKIHSSAFKGLANLVHIDFSANRLTAVPVKALREAAGLQVLKLNENQITALENETFSGLGELERLELNDCAIRSIAASAFKGLVKLQYLYLASNRLVTLARSTFTDLEDVGSLRLLHLYDNPWDCTCRLRWLRLWIETAKITYDFDKDVKATRCKNPLQLRDKKWWRLDSDKFACAPILYSDPHRVISVQQGREVNFTCRVYLDPPKQVAWFHESDAIGYPQGREYYISHPGGNDDRNKTSVLTILKATDSTAGDYRCLARNDAGSAEMVVTINVHNSYINSASLGTSGTSGVIAGVITALLIFVVLAGLSLFYVMFYKRDSDQPSSSASRGGVPPSHKSAVVMNHYVDSAEMELAAIDGDLDPGITRFHDGTILNDNGHYLSSPVHAMDDSLSLQLDPYAAAQVRVSTGNYAQYTLQRGSALDASAGGPDFARQIPPPLHRPNQHSWGNDPMESYDYDDDDLILAGASASAISKTEHLTLTFHEPLFRGSGGGGVGAEVAARYAGGGGGGGGPDEDVVMRNRSTQVPTPTDEDAFIPGPSMSERLRSDTKEKLANIPE